jgi:hypothetical protein
MQASKFLGASLVAVIAVGTDSQAQVIESDCALTRTVLEETADGRFVIGRERLSPLRPTTPILKHPPAQTVVEGNLGMFLPPPGGARESYQEARFEWESGTTPLLVPLLLRDDAKTNTKMNTRRILQIGSTTHYDICLYQTTPPPSGRDLGALCGAEDVRARQATNSQEAGIWLERANCDQFQLAPRPGAGLAEGRVWNYAQPGFKPAYPHPDRSVLKLAWKMRACNVELCSGWTESRELIWVPPPDLKRAGTRQRPGWSLFFTLSRIPNAQNEGSDHSDGEVDARICVAAPGGSCAASGDLNYPGSLWLKRIKVSDNAGQDTEFVDNDPGNGTTAHYWFLNGVHNWSGATCWHPEADHQQSYCVYQENIKASAFDINGR